MNSSIKDKMHKNEKLNIESAPSWAGLVTDAEIIEACRDTNAELELKHSDKGVIYFRKEIVRTSNQAFDRYVHIATSISNPEILQAMSVNEYQLGKNDALLVHRVGIVREGRIIDKTNELNFRVLDDERASQNSQINKTYKANFIVDDLRLGDVLLVEVSFVNYFKKADTLDVSFFRFLHHLPRGYWTYKDYIFSVINERKENLCVEKKYFRNELGEKATFESQKVIPGEAFNFKQEYLHIENDSDAYIPFIEIATESTWKAISKKLFDLYENAYENTKGVADIIAGITHAHSDIDHQIRAIIEYVQNEIVYVFDADIMHGHIPQTPSKTIEQRSGDCKAKSALLISLLAAIGIHADPVLVNYDYDNLIGESLPSPFVFNHMIVRIEHEGTYFIDPTIRYGAGLLPYRAQATCAYYLPIDIGGDVLRSKTIRNTDCIETESKISIRLHRDTAIVESEIIFRKEKADHERNSFRVLDKKKLLDQENDLNLARMMKDRKNSPDAPATVTNSSYVIAENDMDKNEIKLLYKAKFYKPFNRTKSGRIFRYYFGSIDSTELLKFNHKDFPLNHLVSYGIKFNLRIESDRFINQKSSITKRTTYIDNGYFKFINAKKLFYKKIEADIEYVPKTYGRIESNDLKRVQDDYRRIHDSNFGVGFTDYALLEYIGRSKVAMFIVLALITAFLSGLSR